MEENILHNQTVSRVLAEKFVAAQLWVGRDDDATDFRDKLGVNTLLPQYAVVDGDGNIVLKYDRPANVAQMTPEGFAAWLEDAEKAFTAKSVKK